MGTFLEKSDTGGKEGGGRELAVNTDGREGRMGVKLSSTNTVVVKFRQKVTSERTYDGGSQDGHVDQDQDHLFFESSIEQCIRRPNSVVVLYLSIYLYYICRHHHH